MGIMDRIKPGANERARVILMAAEAGMEDDDAKAFADAFKTFDDAKAELDRRAAEVKTKAKPASAKAIVSAVAQAKLPASVAEELIAEGVTMAAVTERLVAMLAERGDRHEYRPRSSAEFGRDHNAPHEVRARMIDGLASRIDRKREPKAGGREFVNMRLDEFAAECIRNGGHGIPPRGAAAVEMALHTTSDFPLILGGATQAILSERFLVGIPQITRVSREMTAPDYRQRNMVRLSSGPQLDEINEGGEIKSGTFEEEGELAPRAKTYGKIFNVSLQALKNDDLGAFDMVARKMGEGATSTVRSVLCGLIEANGGLGQTMRDGNPLFDASRGNMASSGGNLSVTTISAAVTAMRRQKGPAGEILAITPRFLVVAPEKETDGRKMLAQIQAATTNDVNPFAGAMELIVEPGLSNTGAWFVVADPTAYDGLAHAYLDDMPGPRVTTRDGWTTFGLEMRVEMHFGASFTDSRTWYRNAGT